MKFSLPFIASKPSIYFHDSHIGSPVPLHVGLRLKQILQRTNGKTSAMLNLTGV